jgi:hypothetical protein
MESETALGCSHSLAYSMMHKHLKFWKVWARWVPRELKDWEKKNQMILSLQHGAMKTSQFIFNQKV